MLSDHLEVATEGVQQECEDWEEPSAKFRLIQELLQQLHEAACLSRTCEASPGRR